MIFPASPLLPLSGNRVESDEYWMSKALDLAKQAELNDEVPVGALLVKGDKVIAESFNSPIALNDPTAHAEIRVIRQAGLVESNYRLLNTALYVTLEPCCMCAGAIIHSRISRVVFGASDPKGGAGGSCFNLLQNPLLNHVVEVKGGVLNEDAASLLKTFFKRKRKSI
jgi:tRNA(adenine34) deaminase